MIELIPTVVTSFATAMSTNAFKSAKGPAQALDDIMSLVGFEKLHFYAEKKRAKNEIYIKDYKEKIAQELVIIPEESIQEPPLSIVGPALESSKYYIEEEELRTMFAKLIASSMDKRKQKDIHPSFVEVIKQLSSEDAVFLKEFQTYSRLPYGKITAVENKKSASELTEKVEMKKKKSFFELPQFPSFEDFEKEYATKSFPLIDFFYYSKNRKEYLQNEFSISSINRLGLTIISQGAKLTNPSLYEEIEAEFSLMKKQSENDPSKINLPLGYHLNLEKGVIDLSPFGISFFNTCI
jgi:uncharacterized protein YdcH (DUF465 family)